ncbi:hypothetical protein OGAPHI_003509 [Ogataea philodendri]|uniref:Uncharacterized protein n=1 Tax=Ogataea philodendri TaxID=1378263 RepID=A0A9P8T512_9ASCO|nr:uncharacterized protein OGAPHI_003509 [Ogataea philodendri]KAH3666513.1 hypothetical protein OGAPHI_003509 [Ogataea philodendri]
MLGDTISATRADNWPSLFPVLVEPVQFDRLQIGVTRNGCKSDLITINLCQRLVQRLLISIGFHICDLTHLRHPSKSLGTVTLPPSGDSSSSTRARPWSKALRITAVATLADVSSMTSNGAKRPALECLMAGEPAASSSTAAEIIEREILVALDRTAPKPIPGKVKQLLFSEITYPFTVEQFATAQSQGCGHRGHNNSSGTLNVIVEAWELVSISLQDWSSSGDTKIFKVKNSTWESLLDSLNEFVDKLVVLGSSHSLESVTHVQLVFEKSLVVGSNVQNNAHDSSRVDTCTKSHEGSLCDRDTHTTDTLVTNSKDTFTIRNNNVINVFGFAESSESLIDGVWIGYIQETSLWLSESIGVSCDCISFGWSVHDWKQLSNMSSDQFVVQHLILQSHGGTEVISSERCLEVVQLTVSSLNLLIQSVDYRWK